MSRRPDTVGEFPKQRTYAFYPGEFKELTRLRLNSPTVSTVHDFLEQSCTVDTVGEFPKQRTYAFYPGEFKELTRLRLNSPTVSTVHDFLEQSCTVDTVGEFPKQRTYAFYPGEFKDLTRLRLNSPTVSLLPKAYERCADAVWGPKRSRQRCLSRIIKDAIRRWPRMRSERSPSAYADISRRGRGLFDDR